MLDRIKQNAFANLLGKLLLLVQQVALVPIFLWKWGADYYGAWLVVSAIPMTLSLSNLGLGAAAAARIVLELGKGNVREANSLLFNAIIGIFLILGSLTLLLYLIPGEFYPLAGDFPISNASPIIALLMASVLMDSLQGPFEGFYVYKHKASLGIHLKTMSSFFQIMATAIALFSGLDAMGVAFSLLIARIIGMTIYVLGIASELERPFNYEMKWWCCRELIGNGVGFQLGALWQAIYFQGSIWIANALLGPAAAATWATLRILSRAGNQLIVLVNHSVKPELRSVVARFDFNQAKRLYSMASIVTLLLGVAACLGLSAVGGYVYKLWLSGEFSIPYAVWPMLGIGLILNALWWTSSIVYESLNRPWPLNIVGVCAATISVGTMAAVAGASGSIIAFPLGTIIFDGIMAAFIFRGSLKLLDDTWSAFALRAMRGVSILVRKKSNA